MDGVLRPASGSLGRTEGWNPALLLLNGGHRFRCGVVQVLRRCDGQAAVRQDPLGLVHVGSWQGEESGYSGVPPARSNLLGVKDGELLQKKRRWLTGERREKFARHELRRGNNGSATNRGAGGASPELHV